jgi:hypothetical protein
MALEGKQREHDAIAVLRLAEQDEVRIDTGFCLRPDF